MHKGKNTEIMGKEMFCTKTIKPHAVKIHITAGHNHYVVMEAVRCIGKNGNIPLSGTHIHYGVHKQGSKM